MTLILASDVLYSSAMARSLRAAVSRLLVGGAILLITHEERLLASTMNPNPRTETTPRALNPKPWILNPKRRFSVTWGFGPDGKREPVVEERDEVNPHSNLNISPQTPARGHFTTNASPRARREMMRSINPKTLNCHRIAGSRIISRLMSRRGGRATLVRWGAAEQRGWWGRRRGRGGARGRGGGGQDQSVCRLR